MQMLFVTKNKKNSDNVNLDEINKELDKLYD